MTLFDAAHRIYEIGKHIAWEPGDYDQFYKDIPLSREIGEFKGLNSSDLNAVCIVLYNIAGQQIESELPPIFIVHEKGKTSAGEVIRVSATKESLQWVCDPISLSSGKKTFSQALQEVRDRENAAWCLPNQQHAVMGEIALGHGMWSHGVPRTLWYGVFTSVLKEKFNVNVAEPVIAFQQAHITEREKRRFPEIQPMLKNVPEDNISEIYIQRDRVADILCSYIGLDLKHIGIEPKNRSRP